MFLYIQQVFIFFTKNIFFFKSQVRNVRIWMSGFGGPTGKPTWQNFQFESPKMKLREFVRVPTVSDWAKFAVQISKDEALTPLPKIGDFVYFCASITCPSRNFENLQRLSDSTELQTKDITGSSKQEWKRGYKSRENPVPVYISRDASTDRLLASRYRAVWGCTVRQKSGRWRAVWRQVG